VHSITHCAWQQWQRSTFARVRSIVRSPPDSAQPCTSAEHQRTDANAAPTRQAGGHWFERNTAHLAEEPKVLLMEGFWLFGVGPRFPLQNAEIRSFRSKASAHSWSTGSALDAYACWPRRAARVSTTGTDSHRPAPCSAVKTLNAFELRSTKSGSPRSSSRPITSHSASTRPVRP